MLKRTVSSSHLYFHVGNVRSGLLAFIKNILTKYFTMGNSADLDEVLTFESPHLGLLNDCCCPIDEVLSIHFTLRG